LNTEIEEIEAAIQDIMDELHSPITTIPGIGYRMGAMILAEAGDLSRFDSPDELLAYAGMSPSTYQSGQLKNCYPHMEKRGSRYLRYALFEPSDFIHLLSFSGIALIVNLSYLLPCIFTCFRTCTDRRGMPDRRGIFPSIKALRHRNTLCISRRSNAEWQEKARPDGVQCLLVQVLNLFLNVKEHMLLCWNRAYVL